MYAVMSGNICCLTDSYKLVHWKQYPANTEVIFSYFESRTGAVFDATTFFGLQHILRQHLVGARVTEDKIHQARFLSAIHLNQATIEKITPYIIGDEISIYIDQPVLDESMAVAFMRRTINPKLRIDWVSYYKDTAQVEHFNYAGWMHILNAHGGRLPLKIRAVPEGTSVPVNNVLMTVENTDEKVPWLTTYVETILSHIWYPSTVATLSAGIKALIERYLLITASSTNALPFMLHDFGYRGASSYESASIGGAAHLIHFLGSDTIAAMELLMQDYGANLDSLAYSVPATEHSVMTAYGREGEGLIVEELLKQNPTGIISIVGDSYHIENFVENILGGRLRERIINRDGIVVVRPDSVRDDADTPETQMVWLARMLEEKFGATINAKGFKVIHPKIRLLWGDGIDIGSIEKILQAFMEAGFSAENIATFGMGGGLLQKINRDTQRFAFKCSWMKRSGIGYDMFKNPQNSFKSSKKGRLKLLRYEGDDGLYEYKTVPEYIPGIDTLETVFENGGMVNEISLSEIRKNSIPRGIL